MILAASIVMLARASSSFSPFDAASAASKLSFSCVV